MDSSTRTSADGNELEGLTAAQPHHLSDKSKLPKSGSTKQGNEKVVSPLNEAESLSTRQMVEAPKDISQKPVKDEPEVIAMDNTSGLNNLIAVAAAETLNAKLPPPLTDQRAGKKSYQQSLIELSNSIPVAQSLQQSPQNLLFGQPQLTTASAQPQFFIAGPSPSHAGGIPYQQILIPINQPAPMPQNISGGQIPQQYITIPVSLGMGSAQPIQILANPPIIAAANLTGLQPFAMIPGQAGTTESQAPHSKQSAEISSTNCSISAPPMFLSAPNHNIFPPQQLHPSQQPQPSISTSLSTSTDLSSQIAKFLPSIQSLVSTSMNNQHFPTTSTSEISSVIESSSPGANETLVSSTEPGSIIDGINLDDIKEFAKQFKSRRLSMGLTQTQVGQALSVAEGPAYSQSAICRFEKLDITPKSAQKIKPVLERWLQEAEARFHSGTNSSNGADSAERSKKRKRRTSFTPQAVEILTEYFLKNSHPSGSEMTTMANKLGYDREVVRVWFCNKRQALKNAAKRLKPDTSTASDAQSDMPP